MKVIMNCKLRETRGGNRFCFASLRRYSSNEKDGVNQNFSLPPRKKFGCFTTQPACLLCSEDRWKRQIMNEWIWICGSTVRKESRCALRLRYVDVQCLYRRSWTSFPTPFISAQRLSERRFTESVCE
jgi:hypothetical protein